MCVLQEEGPKIPKWKTPYATLPASTIQRRQPANFCMKMPSLAQPHPGESWRLPPHRGSEAMVSFWLCPPSLQSKPGLQSSLLHLGTEPGTWDGREGHTQGTGCCR